MQVTSYGLFWRADEIEWSPGKGNRNEFRLLGRVGMKRPGLRVADFRRQQGIYILYDEYGPAYVGLAKGGKGDRLGARLREHTVGKHAERWDRFSWFGFNPVGSTPDADGVLSLNQPSRDMTDNTETTIRDLEALLIAAMGPKLNDLKMKFGNAQKWDQVGYWEWHETYRPRLESAAS